jgi:RNA polymerase sigma-70 factor (ECF subfamily)
MELYGSLRRLAAVVKPVELEADDLVQEAVVQTLARGPLCEHENPGAYLRRAIVNLAANHRRKLGRQRRAFLRLAQTSEEQATYPSDLQDLQRLKPFERGAVYLAVVEGSSHREIAEALGCTELAARARVSRALRKLRTSLEEEEDLSDA